jgi:DNA-binding NtrC family response regulator
MADALLEPRVHSHGPAHGPKHSGPETSFRRRILVVDDHELSVRQFKKLLEENTEFQVDTAANGHVALEKLTQGNYSLAITDLRMPSLDGMELIQEVQQRRLPTTIIVTTGHGSIDDAVKAIRMGAYDFLTKPIDLDHLRLVMDRALRERMLQDEVNQLRHQLQSQYSFHNILSKNPHMHRIFELINNVANNNTTVLIEGETGTGKEQVARAIHEVSPRRTGPMVAVNCAALPETLLESELFGHEKGAFTNAVGQRRGRFELAQGGTLFLDEVGDVPATMQAKLLRVLQERRFERVGGTETIEVDVRIIAATNRSLHWLMKQGKFREDLYYRLNVIKIDLPPLRERPEDIPLLATHFAAKYARPGDATKKISPEAMDILMNYQWPGNVRELENAIERASVTSRDQVIGPDNLPPELTTPPPSKMPININLDRTLPEVLRDVIANVEQQYIRKALKKSHGNVCRCAMICGLSRRSVTTKIAEYQIDKAVFKYD